MKKVLFLFVSILVISCSSNDETTPNQDPIIGTWSFESRNNEQLNDCEKQSNVIFTISGGYTNTGYYLESNGDCLQDFMNNGTWTNNGNGTYKITVGNENDDIPITFSNNNNTITVSIENGSYTLVYNKN